MDSILGIPHHFVRRVIHKFSQRIHILSGKIQKKTNHTSV